MNFLALRLHLHSVAMLLLLPVFVCPQTIDLNVRGITVGTSHQVVLRKLGKPLATIRGGHYPCDDGPMRTLKYPGLVLRLLQGNDGKGFFVAAVDVTSVKWPVAPKIGIGSGLKEITAKFGTKEIETQNGRKTVSYLMDEGHAVFTFRRAKAVKIAWEFNVC